jgi:hypothetical protein
MDTLMAIDEIDTLRHRLDQLTLLSEALWSLLRDQGYTDEQLVERIERIDLSDGWLDGRHVHREMCIDCGAAMTTAQCQFCGARVDDPFAAA